MFAVKLVATGAASFAGAVLVGVVAMAGREVRRSGDSIIELERAVDSLRGRLALTMPARGLASGRANVATDFTPTVSRPLEDSTAFVDPYASVIGNVRLGKQVYVAPFASIRGDEGQPIFLGDDTNVQDGVVVHALETTAEGKPVPNRTVSVGGRDYAVYIGKRVSLAHQALVHGPARIDDNAFIGMQAMVFRATVGEGVVIEPGAKVIGVTVPPHRYVPAGQTVTEQKEADRLPAISDAYPYRSLNDAVVHVNTSLASGYRRAADSAARSTMASAKPAESGAAKSKPENEEKEEKESGKKH